MSRLEKFYETIVCEDFILLYNFENIFNLPYFERLILDSTSSSFSSNSLVVMQSFGGWLLGTNQKCIKTRARKSIALFDIRKNNLLGLKVTIRKRALFALLDKLLIWVVPQTYQSSVQLLTKQETERKAKLFSELKDAASINTIYKTKLCKAELCQSIPRFSTTFLTISHRRAQLFPEINNLQLFFDNSSGFTVSCSISSRLGYTRFLKKSVNASFPISSSTLDRFLHDISEKKSEKAFGYQGSSYKIKRQFISAFQYPEPV